MEPDKHLNFSIFQKKKKKQLTAENNFRKKSTLDVWEGPKEYQALLWWILPQILTPPLNLKIWCRIPARSLSFWEWHKWQGVGSSCLRHYDALRNKIDMWLTPNI